MISCNNNMISYKVSGVFFSSLTFFCMLLQSCAGCGSEPMSIPRNFQTEETFNDEKPISTSSEEAITDADGKTIVKMIPDRGIYKIPVKINGQLMDFYFDTGAGMISMSEVEVAFLLKQGKISEEDVVGTANFTTANGEKSSNTIIKIKEVSIGNKTIHDVEASVVDNAQAPLLLGQSFLAKFGKISIDYQKNEISFE